MNRTTQTRHLTQSYLAGSQAEDSKKIAAIALSVTFAAGAVIGTFFMCGTDLTLLINTINSTKFYIMAGVTALLSILFLVASTKCCKNFLSNLSDERENRLVRRLLAPYNPE
jgi:hypothetical protein